MKKQLHRWWWSGAALALVAGAALVVSQAAPSQAQPGPMHNQPLAELAGDAFSRLESGVALRKGEPELLDAINKAIDKLKADGTLAKLSEKYFGADVTK